MDKNKKNKVSTGSIGLFIITLVIIGLMIFLGYEALSYVSSDGQNFVFTEGAVKDSDEDGLVDKEDICLGFDDTADTDGDTIPDGCDDTPEGPDSDGDGVHDIVDVCNGQDDTRDENNDGVADCLVDSDGDNIPDISDLCPEKDDTLDSDGNGIPDCLEGEVVDQVSNDTSPIEAVINEEVQTEETTNEVVNETLSEISNNQNTEFNGQLTSEEVSDIQDIIEQSQEISMEELGRTLEIDPIILIENPIVVDKGEKVTKQYLIDNASLQVFDDEGDLTQTSNVYLDVSQLDTNKLGTYPITIFATDSKGNESTMETVIVVATAKPVISVDTTDIVMSYEEFQQIADWKQYIKENYQLSVYDSKDGELVDRESVSVDVINTPSKISSETKILGEIQITATDSDGNKTVMNANKIVQLSKPVITGNESLNVEVNDSGFDVSDPVDVGLKATDVIDGDITSSIKLVTQNPEFDITNSGNENIAMTYELSYVATNSNGVESTPFTVAISVVPASAPIIEGSTKKNVQVGVAFDFMDPNELNITAFDLIDGDITSSIKLLNNYGLDNDTNTNDEFIGDGTDSIGTYTFDYIATDKEGNTSEPWKYTIEVTEGSAPIISGPSNVYLNYGQLIELDNPSDFGISANDLEDGVITNDLEITNNVSTTRPGVEFIGNGKDLPDTYKLTYEVSDSFGDTATPFTMTVWVIDNQDPEFSGDIAKRMVWDDAELDLNNYNSLSITASDDVDGDITHLYDETNGIKLINSDDYVSNKIGSYNIQYQAIDSSGNKSDVLTYKITVEDVVNPVISGEDDSTIQLGDDINIYDPKSLGITAYDDYDQDISSNVILVDDANFSSSIMGTYNLKYSVRDSFGNLADDYTYTINVVDTTRPFISGSDAITIDYGTSLNIESASSVGITGSDRQDGNISNFTQEQDTAAGIYVHDAGGFLSQSIENLPGIYDISYMIRDSNGNVSAEAYSYKITVNDSEKPVIVRPNYSDNTQTYEIGSDELLNLNIKDAGSLGLIASDNVDELTSSDIKIVSGEKLFNQNKIGTYEIGYQVNDSSDNKSDIYYLVIMIVDTQAPVITGTNDEIFLQIHDNFNPNNLEDLGITITDNYDTNISSNV